MIDKIAEAQFRSQYTLSCTPIHPFKYDLKTSFGNAFKVDCELLEEMVAFRVGIFATMLAKTLNQHVGVYIGDGFISVIPANGRVLDLQ